MRSFRTVYKFQKDYTEFHEKVDVSIYLKYSYEDLIQTYN